MRDYEVRYPDFSPQALERQALHGSLAGGLNACVECCDRWANGGRVALEWIGRDFTLKTVTFLELQQAAARFANFLASSGIGSDDCPCLDDGGVPQVGIRITVTSVSNRRAQSGASTKCRK
jgi:acetyl-CoA synthetase